MAASTCFGEIPARAHPFYMSDCANPIADKKMHRRPIKGLPSSNPARLAVVETAIWNDDLTTGRVPFYQRDTAVDIYILEVSLAATPLPHKNNRNLYTGLNTDLQIGIYSVPGSGPASYVMDRTALFRSPYGEGEGFGPNTGGQVINSISTVHSAPTSYRRFGAEAPLMLRIVAPSLEGRYALGVVLTLNHGYGDAVDFHYQFHIHGAHCPVNE
jgi:hypothetical protein